MNPGFPFDTIEAQHSQLFSHTYFAPENSVAASSKVTHLEVGRTYNLVINLRDTPFDGQIAQSVARRENLRSVAAGTKVEVDYFSPFLAPSSGSTLMTVPESEIAAQAVFAIRPTVVVTQGSMVGIAVKLNGMAFDNFVLSPVITALGVAPKDEPIDPSRKSERKVTPRAIANVRDIGVAEVNLSIISPANESGKFRFRLGRNRNVHELIVDGESHFSSKTIQGRIDDARTNLQEAVNLLNNSANGEPLNGGVIGPGYRQHLLRVFAKEGHYLYAAIFSGNKKLEAALEEIRDSARRSPDNPIRFQIEMVMPEGIRLVLPFGLLYDDPKFKDDESYVVDPKFFWDYSYQIENVDHGVDFNKTGLCENHLVRTAMIIDQSKANHDFNEDEVVSQIKSADNSRFKTTIIPDDTNFKALFKNKKGPFDFIYYYGHTMNEKNAPYFVFGRGDPIELRVLGEFWFAKTTKNEALHDHPFVFLNSCRVGAMPGFKQDSFLDVFEAARVSALMGSEISIHPVYAAGVGRKLLDEMAIQNPSNTLSRFIWELKHQVLRLPSGNPLMLLYSLWGGAGVQLCSSGKL